VVGNHFATVIADVVVVRVLMVGNHFATEVTDVISNHEDADNNHICDYCGKVITNHIGGIKPAGIRQYAKPAANPTVSLIQRTTPT